MKMIAPTFPLAVRCSTTRGSDMHVPHAQHRRAVWYSLNFHNAVRFMSEQKMQLSKLLGTGDAVGRTLRWTRTNETLTIVGIVSHVRHYGLAAPPRETVYRPCAQYAASPEMFVEVRARGAVDRALGNCRGGTSARSESAGRRTAEIGHSRRSVARTAALRHTGAGCLRRDRAAAADRRDLRCDR